MTRIACSMWSGCTGEPVGRRVRRVIGALAVSLAAVAGLACAGMPRTQAAPRSGGESAGGAAGESDGDVGLRPGLLPRDAQGLAVSPLVRAQLAQLMRRALRDRVEPAACVAPGGYRVRRHATKGGREVDVWALTLANADSADSMHVWYAGRACDDTLPLVHGHVVANTWLRRPSPIDVDGVNGRRAPFNLLVYPDARDTVALHLFWRASP